MKTRRGFQEHLLEFDFSLPCFRYCRASDIAVLRILLGHESLRATNGFLWESNASTTFSDWLAGEQKADIVVGTCSGIPEWFWVRECRSAQSV